MAENLSTTDELNQILQHTLTVTPNNEEVVPGTLIPYELPLGQMEEPFDSISIFAIRESQGPLNEEQLKHFLKGKNDKRAKKQILPKIRYLTNDIDGFEAQLEKLENRMIEIQYKENELMNLVKNRIKEMIETMTDNKQLPRWRKLDPRLAIVVQKAIQTVGVTGPLTADNLNSIIITGRDGFPPGTLTDIPGRRIIIQQLMAFKENIKIEEAIRKTHFNFVLENIRKARYDIIHENLQMPEQAE